MGFLAIGNLLAGRMRAASAARVLVVFPSAVEACREAAAGLSDGLGKDSVALGYVDLSVGEARQQFEREMAHNPVLTVAVGSEAVQAVQAQGLGGATVSTMTLHADEETDSGRRSKVKAGIYLDLPVALLLSALGRVLPNKRRIGVIRNPARPGPSVGGLRAQAAEHSFDAVVAECPTAEDLLPGFLRLRGKVDVVICLPDTLLYNSATIRPLILASLENRLPIIGFSAGFVRAGAALGIYPDFRNIGRQTADLVRRCLSASCNSFEGPRSVSVAVNPKVVRLLGLDLSGDLHDVIVLR